MRFLWTFLASVGLIVGCILTALTIINPRREFAGTHFPALHPNTRRLKTESFIAYNATAPVSGVIIGSSRSMKLSPPVFDTLTGHRYFNFGVFSGTLEDDLAIVRYVIRRAPTLKTIILGVDPDAFSADNTPLIELKHTLPLQEALEQHTFGPIGHLLRVGAKYRDALTMSYLTDAWISFRVSADPPEPIYTFSPDGTLGYVQWDRALAAGKFNMADPYEACAQSQLSFFTRYRSVSAEKRAILDSLLNEVASHRLRVILWIPPVHPALFRRIVADSARKQHWNQAIAAIVAIRAPGVTVLDLSTLPGLENAGHWYDCLHFDHTIAHTIAERLANASNERAEQKPL